MQSNGKSNDKLFSETQDKVKRWLKDADFNYGRNLSQSGVAWGFDATGVGGFAGTFCQNVGHPETLWLTLTMQFDAYQGDIKALSHEQSRDLMFTLRQRLLQIGTRFVFGDNLITVTLTEQMFTETLTRESFWAGVNRVLRSMDCAKWTLDEKLPEPPSR